MTQNDDCLDRRTVLSKLGAAGVALTTTAGVTAASGRPDDQPVRTFELDTSGYEGLGTVAVEFYPGGVQRVSLEGHRPQQSTAGGGYRIALEDAFNPAGKFTPGRASATIEAVEPPESMGTAESETVSQGDSLGTMSHGDIDPTQDNEGGLWAQSENVLDGELTQTEQHATWEVNNDEVTHIDRAWKGTTYNSAWTTLDSTGFCELDWSGDTVFSKVCGNYEYNGGSQSSHHRLDLTGQPNGRMTWATDHWHQGNFSFRVDAGYYSKDSR